MSGLIIQQSIVNNFRCQGNLHIPGQPASRFIHFTGPRDLIKNSIGQQKSTGTSITIHHLHMLEIKTCLSHRGNHSRQTILFLKFFPLTINSGLFGNISKHVKHIPAAPGSIIFNRRCILSQTKWLTCQSLA